MTTETMILDLDQAPAIDGLTFRRPRGDDADYEAMAEMISAANIIDRDPWLPTGRSLREEVEERLGSRPEVDDVLAEIDGRLVAHASVDRNRRDGTVVFQVAGHVHPDVRRRGLGRALLAENLRHATERASIEPPEQPVEVRAVVGDPEVGHRALLEAAGFEPIRWTFVMRRATNDDIPDTPLPDGLELRPVTPDQHRAIWEAAVEAFRDHWGAREKAEADFHNLFAREDLDTSLWVVAWDGNEVAGVVQNWIWTDENERLGVARGWLEQISVRRPWRRRGLGRAITAASLRRLRDAGMTEGMLGVDVQNPTGALALYEGLGFEVHGRWTVYRRAIDR